MTEEERRALALAEVQNKRPANRMAVSTLEFKHSALNAPARVVADNEDLIARLEDGSEAHFLAVAFQAAPPAQAESRWPQIELRIDGASQLIEPLLEQTLGSDEPVEVIFREYVRDMAMDGPGRVIAGLQLDGTRASDLTITGTAGFFGLDKRFGKLYDPETYPTIA